MLNFLTEMDPVALTALIVGLLGLASGAALALAARFLAVREDPRIAAVTDLLPGINCGGCGYAGCADYARAIVKDGAPVALCAPAGPDTIGQICSFLGRAAETAEKKVAIVRCGGDADKAPRRFAYNGVADCAAAHAVGGGDKRCGYGCLGYGSCARVCPVGAIEMKNGLARVHKDLCIGCSLCVKACPRHLICMIPPTRTIHVLCRSQDKGPVVKKACSVGCIGCTRCAKLVDDAQIGMEGPLAVVDYDRPLDNEEVVEKCPTNCIVKE